MKSELLHTVCRQLHEECIPVQRTSPPSSSDNLLLHSVDEDLRGRPADAIWLLMACSHACISCTLLEGGDCNMPTYSAWPWLPTSLAACFR